MFHPSRLRRVATFAVVSLILSTAAIAGGRPLLVTVDDLPIASRVHVEDADERVRVTRDLLEALRRHDIQAVGFVTWKNVRDRTDRQLLEMWLDADHELGNHTALHTDLNQVGADAYIEDVEAGRELLAQLLEPRGAQPRYFRFTYLHEGSTIDEVRALRDHLAATGQRALPATIHTRDWAFEKPYLDARATRDRRARDRVLDEYQASVRASIRHLSAAGERLTGDPDVPQILLLHANAIGAQAWDELFTFAREEGFRFATPDEVLSHPALADLEPRPTTRSFGHWERLADKAQRERAIREVRALLERQSEAWSRGDLETFVSAYADDVVFVSPSGMTQGREAVLARYRTRYPDGAAMGALSIEILELRPAAGYEATREGDAFPSKVHGVSVVARWTLSYPPDAGKQRASGLTLLVLHPTSEGWLIVQDASM